MPKGKAVLAGYLSGGPFHPIRSPVLKFLIRSRKRSHAILPRHELRMLRREILAAFNRYMKATHFRKFLTASEQNAVHDRIRTAASHLAVAYRKNDIPRLQTWHRKMRDELLSATIEIKAAIYQTFPDVADDSIIFLRAFKYFHSVTLQPSDISTRERLPILLDCISSLGRTASSKSTVPPLAQLVATLAPIWVAITGRTPRRVSNVDAHGGHVYPFGEWVCGKLDYMVEQSIRRMATDTLKRLSAPEVLKLGGDPASILFLEFQQRTKLEQPVTPIIIYKLVTQAKKSQNPVHF